MKQDQAAYAGCTGNKAVYFLWLHRNNMYNIAALEQLSRMVVHKGKLHALKCNGLSFASYEPIGIAGLMA